MKLHGPKLQQFTIEVRYESGYLYLDRCGRILLDIEHEREGWYPDEINPQQGQISNPEYNYNVSFNAASYRFTANKAFKANMDQAAQEAESVWKVIQANLDLHAFLRIGFRLIYYRPTKSREESERLIGRARLNIDVPDSIRNEGYKMTARQVIAVMEKGENQYRVELGGITQTEAITPPDILRDDPKSLSKKQKQYRTATLKRISQYSGDPMYAVKLDVDCVRHHPEKIAVERYITEQTEIVKKDFYPLLEEL